MAVTAPVEALAAGLPGAAWPVAFMVVCAICAGLAGGLTFLRHRMGWL